LKKSENISFFEKRMTIFTLSRVKKFYFKKVKCHSKKVRFHSKKNKVRHFFLRSKIFSFFFQGWISRMVAFSLSWSEISLQEI